VAGLSEELFDEWRQKGSPREGNLRSASDIGITYRASEAHVRN
jgi:hypothetical protein